MSRRGKVENADGTSEAPTLGDVATETVDAPKKKRTVRYFLVKTPREGEKAVIVDEFKSRQKADGFLEAVARLPGVNPFDFFIIKGKVLDNV